MAKLSPTARYERITQKIYQRHMKSLRTLAQSKRDFKNMGAARKAHNKLRGPVRLFKG